MQSQLAVDQSCTFGLTNLETIPIRGFLTREILLSKVVYSVTFEEHKMHACVQESGETPQNRENESQHKKQPYRKGPPGRKQTRSTVLSKDDQLLIELKEEKGLPWKRIAEYFPGRSEGSLSVRYCTRLKRRHNARPESTYNVKENSPSCQAVACEEPRSSCGVEVAVNKGGSARELSRLRYGPPRRRQNVDRYSPV